MEGSGFGVSGFRVWGLRVWVFGVSVGGRGLRDCLGCVRSLRVLKGVFN